ncbi:unnamed protein product, partial [Mesorhabditis spiculigera]
MAMIFSESNHQHAHGDAAAVVVHGAIDSPQEAKSILEAGGANPSNKDQPVDSPRLIPKDVKLMDGIQGARVKRDADHGHAHGAAEHGNIHAQIGYSLVVGFIFMLLVDQVSNIALSKSDRNGRQRIGLSATIGLVVHAAADGVALGGASSINRTDVQMIVFMAIMLHKGPASFGLVSFLIMEGLDKRAVKKHLLVFSSAAPTAAILTYMIIGGATDGISGNDSTIGILMLFSAGTFLYVATVHVLPELASQSKNYDLLVMDIQSPSTLRHSHSHGVSFSMTELFYMIVGAVIPAILASGHSH